VAAIENAALPALAGTVAAIENAALPALPGASLPDKPAA